MSSGSLVVVGTGIRIANQCTIEARYQIESADIVFEVVGDVLAQQFLRSLNANTISLQHLYGRGRSRNETYEAMVETILSAVRAGKRVCAAFYGHPGVYVYPSHESVRRARAEGFEAEMLPAVSAEACLFADLGFDPGWLGCQSFEATDFVVNERKFDPTAVLILWQISVVGDRTLRLFESDPRRVAILADVLMETYPAGHRVQVYRAATLPLGQADVQTFPLSDLVHARIMQESTLIVPPLGQAKPSPARVAMIEARLNAA